MTKAHSKLTNADLGIVFNKGACKINFEGFLYTPHNSSEDTRVNAFMSSFDSMTCTHFEHLVLILQYVGGSQCLCSNYLNSGHSASSPFISENLNCPSCSGQHPRLCRRSSFLWACCWPSTLMNPQSTLWPQHCSFKVAVMDH